MTTTDLKTIANTLVAREVNAIWIAVLIMVQKDAVRITGLDAKGNKTYAYTGNGLAIDRRWILVLKDRGLIQMLAGQPRLTEAGTKAFYLFVNGK